MNANNRREIKSMSFILRSTNLLYSLSQYKYIQYYKLSLNMSEIANVEPARSVHTGCEFVIFLVDNRNKSTINIIKSCLENNVKVMILCTYRCYDYLNLNLGINNILKIDTKLMYDLNITKVNQEIYKLIKDKIPLNIKSLCIINIYIDGLAESISVDEKTVNISDWNNLKGGIVAGRYILYMFSIFMNKYFLLEIGKNKQAKDKIENKIKYLKLQLLNSNIVVKKQIEHE